MFQDLKCICTLTLLQAKCAVDHSNSCHLSAVDGSINYTIKTLGKYGTKKLLNNWVPVRISGKVVMCAMAIEIERVQNQWHKQHTHTHTNTERHFYVALCIINSKPQIIRIFCHFANERAKTKAATTIKATYIYKIVIDQKYMYARMFFIMYTLECSLYALRRRILYFRGLNEGERVLRARRWQEFVENLITFFFIIIITVVVLVACWFAREKFGSNNNNNSSNNKSNRISMYSWLRKIKWTVNTGPSSNGINLHKWQQQQQHKQAQWEYFTRSDNQNEIKLKWDKNKLHEF